MLKRQIRTIRARCATTTDSKPFLSAWKPFPTVPRDWTESNFHPFPRVPRDSRKNVPLYWKLGSIDSLLKRICKMGTIVRQPGSDRLPSSCSSGEDLVLSQAGNPKRHRSAHEISHETAILHSSVHRIIYCNLQLKCFKRRPAQLLSEANSISHLTQ